MKVRRIWLLAALLMLSLTACDTSSEGGGDKSASAEVGPSGNHGDPGKPSNDSQTMKFTDANFEAFVNGFKPGMLPISFPLSQTDLSSIKNKVVSAEEQAAYVCGSGMIDCNEEEMTEFFKAYRIPVSDQAIALLYHGIGEQDAFFVLATYGPGGKMLSAEYVHGEFGDMDHGYEGILRPGPSIERERHTYGMVDGDIAKQKQGKETLAISAAGMIGK